MPGQLNHPHGAIVIVTGYAQLLAFNLLLE